jgi:hypothetical protein
MRQRPVILCLAFAAVTFLDGAVRLPPPKHSLAYIVMTDVQSGPPGDENPESTAVRLKREVELVLGADSVLVVAGLLEDTLTACTGVAAKACDFVFVRQQIESVDPSKIAVSLEVRNKHLPGHRKVIPEPRCDRTIFWPDWQHCRDKHLGEFAVALRDHASTGHAK